MAESAIAQVHDHRERYRRMSAEYAAVGECLNDGHGRISEPARGIAAATRSLSSGTNDRDCNEVKYLQEALGLLESLHRRNTHRKGWWC